MSLYIFRPKIAGIVLVIYLVCISTTISAQDENRLSADKALESFEAYCFRTLANYTHVEGMATAMKLSPLPDEFMTAGISLGAKNGKGYFIERSDSEGKALLLGISKPDTCSIFARGIKYENVKKILHENYKLKLFFRDDVGLQVSEMYVPGGKSGDMSEAMKLGLVLVIYPKQDVSIDGFTIGFVPPETVKIQH